MSGNVIGIHSCETCQAPLPTDRRRRYCDDCRPAARVFVIHRAKPDVDTSRAGRAKRCACSRPTLYRDGRELRCHSCGHEAVAAHAA